MSQTKTATNIDKQVNEHTAIAWLRITDSAYAEVRHYVVLI